MALLFGVFEAFWPGPCQSALDLRLRGASNAILTERKEKNKRPARKAVHLFSGLAFCTCGHKMYVPSITPKYVCYECRNKIPVGDLEEVLHEQLKHFFFSPEDITEYLQHADHVLKEKEALLHTLESEQGKVVQEMDRVYRLYVNDKITADAFSERYRPLEDRSSPCFSSSEAGAASPPHARLSASSFIGLVN